MIIPPRSCERSSARRGFGENLRPTLGACHLGSAYFEPGQDAQRALFVLNDLGPGNGGGGVVFNLLAPEGLKLQHALLATLRFSACFSRGPEFWVTGEDADDYPALREPRQGRLAM
jgi:hypothetical protein